MVSMKVSDEDLGEAARSEVALHHLHLTPLSTIKHPQTNICDDVYPIAIQTRATQHDIVCSNTISLCLLSILT